MRPSGRLTYREVTVSGQNISVEIETEILAIEGENIWATRRSNKNVNCLTPTKTGIFFHCRLAGMLKVLWEWVVSVSPCSFLSRLRPRSVSLTWQRRPCCSRPGLRTHIYKAGGRTPPPPPPPQGRLAWVCRLCWGRMPGWGRKGLEQGRTCSAPTAPARRPRRPRGEQTEIWGSDW